MEADPGETKATATAETAWTAPPPRQYRIPRVRQRETSPPRSPPARRGPPAAEQWTVRQPQQANGAATTRSAPTADNEVCLSVWELSLDVWDVEDRPLNMQDPRY